MAKKADFFAKASLRGVDDLSVPWGKALAKAERKAGRSFSRIEKFGMRAGRAWRTLEVGAGMRGLRRGAGAATSAFKSMGVASIAVAGGAALAVDQFGKYELAVARLGNVIGDGIDPVKEFDEQIKRISISTGTDPIEAAQAAYMAFSGGVDQTREGLEAFLPVALRAAKAGFAEPAVAVDAMTSALNTFKDEGLTAAMVADKLFVTEALGKTDFGKIASEIGNVASFAKQMGLSLDETLAPMAALTKTGLSTGSAFTQVSAIISGIVKPTEKAKKQFKRLKDEFGLEFGADAITNMGGIQKTIERIQSASKGKKGKNIITAMFGRKEAIKGVLALTGSQLEDLDKTMKALQNSAGTADKNFANVEQRTGFRIAQMKSGFSQLVNELGGGIADGLGLNEIGNIPDAVQSAGKKMRSGAKNFAQGFLQALSPGKDLANLDFDQMALDAGKSFGSFLTVATKLASALLSVASSAVSVGKAVAALASGDDDPLSNTAKKHGVTLKRARKAGEGQGPAGALSALGVAKSQADLRKRGVIGKDLTAQQVFQRSQARRKRLDANAARGSSITRGGRRGEFNVGAALARAKAGAGLGGGAPVAVGGEIKVSVDINAEGKVTGSQIEANSKNAAVPIVPNVGKRKVGQ